jgi:hypothetical protein
MVTDTRLHVAKLQVADMKSPFFTPDYLLTARSQLTNCQCNSTQEAYCIHQGNQDWYDLHWYWKYHILPDIKNIHVDHYWRYDMWLSAPGNTLKTDHMEQFANYVRTIQDKYIVN